MDRLDRIGDVVVICDSHGAAAETVRGHLAARGIGEAAWVGARDADDVDRAVAAGRVRRVIWPDVAAWLTALWDGTLRPAHWQRVDLTIEFVDAVATPPATARAIAAAWERWRRRQRRRQAVAGAALSVVALVAAFALVTLA